MSKIYVGMTVHVQIKVDDGWTKNGNYLVRDGSQILFTQDEILASLKKRSMRERNDHPEEPWEVESIVPYGTTP